MTAAVAPAARFAPLRLPDPPGRDAAREAAERELSDPIYARDDPSWLDRAILWVLESIGGLFERAADLAPGGYLGLVVIVALIVLIAVVIRLRVGRIGRVATGERALFESSERSAEDHRRAADAHAARGEWADAVRERLRGVVRGLEERDLLDVRPGRTAGEAATDAGRALPGCAVALRDAARAFDDVVYGGRPATVDTEARIREVDAAVRRARPAAVRT